VKQKSIISLDILRIISGLFVVLIHVTDPFILFEEYAGGLSWVIIFAANVFARVAVPLFILISGYLLLRPEKVENYKEFYKRRLNRIGVPVVFWIAFFFVWQALWMGISVSIPYVLHTLFTVTIGPLYFLIVILQLYFFAPFFLKIMQRLSISMQILLVVFFALASVAINFIPQFFFNSSYHTSENMVTISLPYICYFLAGGILRNVKVKLLVAIMLFLVYILLGVLSIVSAMSMGLSILSYSSPTIMLMSLSLFVAVISLERYFSDIGGVLRKSIHILAAATFGIYLVHSFVIDILNTHTTLKPGYILSPLWGNAFMIVVLVFVLSFLVTSIGRRIALTKRLFG